MIKAVIFVDGQIDIWCNNAIRATITGDDADRVLLMDAAYGYSANKHYIDEVLKYNKEIVIITNSLIVYNDNRLKEATSASDTNSLLLNNYYLIDRNEVLRSLQDLTDKELHISHNLEKMYINNGFEKLEELEKC